VRAARRMAGGGRLTGASLRLHPMSPFWIWVQVAIVVCVLAGAAIAVVKLA
jgi:hypothetical protein